MDAQHCWISNVWNCCVHASSGVQRDATTPNIVGSVMFGIVVSMLAMVCKGMRQLQHCCISNVWHRCVHAGSGVQRDATTPNIVGSAMFGIVVSMQAGRCAKGCDNSNIVASEQCLASLCPCWQWCAKGCNNSQHCWVSNVWNCCVHAGRQVCKGMRRLQHCCISNVWNRCVYAGSGVQRDAPTLSSIWTCSALWEGYNP